MFSISLHSHWLSVVPHPCANKWACCWHISACYILLFPTALLLSTFVLVCVSSPYSCMLERCMFFVVLVISTLPWGWISIAWRILKIFVFFFLFLQLSFRCRYPFFTNTSYLWYFVFQDWFCVVSLIDMFPVANVHPFQNFFFAFSRPPVWAASSFGVYLLSQLLEIAFLFNVIDACKWFWMVLIKVFRYIQMDIHTFIHMYK